MALLLERLSDGDYPAEFWLLAQLRWDLEQARRALPSTREALVQPAPLPGPADQLVERAGESQLLELSTAVRGIAEGEASGA